MIQYWADQEPLMMVIENAHWMDEASASLTEVIAKQLVAAHQVFFLLVRRGQTGEDDSPLAKLNALAHHRVLQVNELPDNEIADLVCNYLGGEAEPLLVAVIQEMARGNPLFAGELVETLRQSDQIITDSDGRWRTSPDMLALLRAGDLLTRQEDHWLLKPDVDLSTVKLESPTRYTASS